MITGWPKLSDSFCPTIRAIRSLPPPGVKPTTIWIARVGYLAGSSCAREAPVIAPKATPRHRLIATLLREIFMDLELRDLHVKHRSLAIVERGKTTVDRCREFIWFGDAFAM